MNWIFAVGIVVVIFIFWLWIEKWKLIQPSVIEALKMAYRKHGAKFFIDGRAFNIVAYGRWIPQYIRVYQRLMAWAGPGAKKWMADTYHGKVLTTMDAKSIINLDHDIPFQELSTKIVPYRTARDFLVKANPDICVTECACRAISGHGCKPSQVCMAIGHPFTDFILEHRPETTRRITREEAVEILDDANRRGWVHHAYFKDCAFNGFYAICNCCPECCTGFKAQKLGIDMICASGYQILVDNNMCKGCGTCVKRCPFEAVALVDGKSVLNLSKCMGCGVCIPQCSNNARTLEIGGELEPLTIRGMRQSS